MNIIRSENNFKIECSDEEMLYALKRAMSIILECPSCRNKAFEIKVGRA